MTTATVKKTSRRVDGPVASEVQVPVAPVAPATDFFEALGGITDSKTPAEKKSKKKGINLPKNLMEAIDEIVSWKKKEKEAKAERESLEATVIEHVMPIQEDYGFSNQYEKSYRLDGVKEKVTYVTSDRFSSIKLEDKDEIQKILGNRFSEFVTLKRDTKLVPAVYESTPEGEALRKELMSMIPADKFQKFFESSASWEWVDGFDQKRFSLSKKVYEAVKSFFRQAKPSLR